MGNRVNRATVRALRCGVEQALKLVGLEAAPAAVMVRAGRHHCTLEG